MSRGEKKEKKIREHLCCGDNKKKEEKKKKKKKKKRRHCSLLSAVCFILARRQRKVHGLGVLASEERNGRERKKKVHYLMNALAIGLAVFSPPEGEEEKKKTLIATLALVQASTRSWPRGQLAAESIAANRGKRGRKEKEGKKKHSSSPSRGF